jgi:transcription elongation factor GreA
MTPVLTADGRAQLGARAARLRDTVLPELRDALADSKRDGEVVLEYERALLELRRLDALLASAVALEDRPHDPSIVELGDLVVLELDDGSIERFRLVDPVEAALDDVRISVASPLAQALLGRRVGDVVDVTAPGSSYCCRVLGAIRPEPT